MKKKVLDQANVMGKSQNRKSRGGDIFFVGEVRGLCPLESAKMVIFADRSTHTTPFALSLRCRVLHGCDCLGAEFQEQRCRKRLTRFETNGFQTWNFQDSNFPW